MFKNGKWCCCKVQFLLSVFILLNAQLNVGKNSTFFSEARNLMTKLPEKTRLPYKTVNSGSTNFPPLMKNKNVAAVQNETLLNSFRLKREHGFGTILNQTSENYNSASDKDNESSSDEQDPLPPETFGFAGVKEIAPLETIGRSNPRMYKEKIERRSHLFLWDKIGRNYQQQLHNHNIVASGTSKILRYDTRRMAPESPKIINLKGSPPIEPHPSSLVNLEKLGDTSKFNTIEKLGLRSVVGHVGPEITAKVEKLGESFVLIKRVLHEKIASPASLITDQSHSRTIGKSNNFPTTSYYEKFGKSKNTLKIIGIAKLPETQHAVPNLTPERIGKSKSNYFTNQIVALSNATRLPPVMEQLRKENQNMSLVQPDAGARGQVQLPLRFKQEITPVDNPKITAKVEKPGELFVLIKRVLNEKIAATPNFIDNLSQNRPIGKSDNSSTTTYPEKVGKSKNTLSITGIEKLPQAKHAVPNLTQERIGKSQPNYLDFTNQSAALPNATRLPHVKEQLGKENKNMSLVQKNPGARGQVQIPLKYKQEITPAYNPKITVKVEKLGELFIQTKRVPDEKIAATPNFIDDLSQNRPIGKSDNSSTTTHHEEVGKSKNTLEIIGMKKLSETQHAGPNLTLEIIGKSQPNYLDFTNKIAALSNATRLSPIMEQFGKENQNMSLVQKDAGARGQVQIPLTYKQEITPSDNPITLTKVEKIGESLMLIKRFPNQKIASPANVKADRPYNSAVAKTEKLIFSAHYDKVGKYKNTFSIIGIEKIPQTQQVIPNLIQQEIGKSKHNYLDLSKQNIALSSVIRLPVVTEQLGKENQNMSLVQMDRISKQVQRPLLFKQKFGLSKHSMPILNQEKVGTLPYNHGGLIKQEIGTLNSTNVYVPKNRIGHSGTQYFALDKQGIGQAFRKYSITLNQKTGDLNDSYSISPQEIGKYTNLASRPPEKIGQWIPQHVPRLHEISASQPNPANFTSLTEQIGQPSNNFTAMTSTGFGKLNYTLATKNKEKIDLQNQLLRISKEKIGQSHHKPKNLTQADYQGIGHLREQSLGIPTEEVGKLQDLLPTFSRDEVGTVAQIVPYIQRNRIGALAQLLITLKKTKTKFGNLTKIFKSLSTVKIAKLGPPSIIKEKLGNSPRILPNMPNGKIGAPANSVISKTDKSGVNIHTFVEDKDTAVESEGFTSFTSQGMYTTPIPDLHPLQDPMNKNTSPHYLNSFSTTIVLKAMSVTNFDQTNQSKTSVISEDNSTDNSQNLAAVTVTEPLLAKSKSTQFQSTSVTPLYSYSTSQQQLLSTVPSSAVKSASNSRLPNTSKNHTKGVNEKRKKKQKKILSKNNTAAPSRLTTARRQRLKSSKRGVSFSNKSLLHRLVEELKVIWDNAWTILKV